MSLEVAKVACSHGKETKGYQRKKKVFFSLENSFAFYTETENDVDGQYGEAMRSISFVLFPDFVLVLDF